MLRVEANSKTCWKFKKKSVKMQRDYCLQIKMRGEGTIWEMKEKGQVERMSVTA